jgi:hypothetical protein
VRLDHIIYLELIRFVGILRVLNFVFQLLIERSGRIFGDIAGEATPVPIPNTEVKLFRADDTAPARVWESRTLPDLNKSLSIFRQAFFMYIFD